jgi:hypothetical protein
MLKQRDIANGKQSYKRNFVTFGGISVILGLLMMASSPVMADWKEQTSKNCYRICKWKSVITRCKGPFGVPVPCQQWQKRCGEERCWRKSH